MDKFIEITDINDNKVLIGIAHIIRVEEFAWANGDFRFTQIALVGEQFPKTKERYEEIKKKIENAGKTIFHCDFYKRRSE